MIAKGNPNELLYQFLKFWKERGVDEMSICSGALDALAMQLVDRPSCVWKWTGTELKKLCERGIVDLNVREFQITTLKSTQFDPLPADSDSAVSSSRKIEGFLHLLLKTESETIGMLSVGVSKQEAANPILIQPLEAFATMVSMALSFRYDREVIDRRERRLKAELEAASRELERTNKRLIERVRELKTLYKELHKRVQELTKANKAKDEFLSIVSHELRTPLTSLTGFLSVLLEEEAGPLSDQQRKFLRITKQSADRLNVIISDLLDVSRIEAGRLQMNMAVCSFDDILSRSVEGLKSTARKKDIQLNFRTCGELPAIWGDHSRLQQVIDNLISNAIKFTEPKGTIEVFVDEKGDFIQVSVQDTGHGLSNEEQAKVFDMFYQADASTRRPAGGAGLGLAIARGIVTMHGGQILVNSEKGIGSTFSFLIPRYKDQKKAA